MRRGDVVREGLLVLVFQVLSACQPFCVMFEVTPEETTLPASKGDGAWGSTTSASGSSA